MKQRDGGIFGDVVLSVIGLGGEVKRGCGIATRRFIEKHRGRNGQFFLSILVAHRLSILQGYPLKHFSYPSTTGCPCMELTGCSPN